MQIFWPRESKRGVQRLSGQSSERNSEKKNLLKLVLRKNCENLNVNQEDTPLTIFLRQGIIMNSEIRLSILTGFIRLKKDKTVSRLLKRRSK